MLREKLLMSSIGMSVRPSSVEITLGRGHSVSARAIVFKYRHRGNAHLN